MSTANPEQPAPTPFRITLVVEFPSKEGAPPIGKDSLSRLWNCEVVSLAFDDLMAENENKAAKQPDAGVQKT